MRMRLNGLAMMLMAGALLLAGCGESQPGANSPEAAVKKMDQALQDEDKQALAGMLPDSQQDAAYREGAAEMLVEMKRLGDLREQAYEKFDKEKVRQELGFSAMMFEAMSPPDFQKMAAEGELEQDGETATYTLKSEGGSGPMGPGQRTQTIDLVKEDGRWFMSMEGEKMPPAKQMQKSQQAMKDFIAALEEAVNNSDDAQAFAGKVQSEMRTMMQAMTPEGTSMPTPPQ